MDGGIAVAWVSLNALLLGTIWRLCRRTFPHDTAAQTATHTLVLYWAAVVLTCFVLGGWPVLSGSSVMAAGVVLVVLFLGVPRVLSATDTSAKSAPGGPQVDGHSPPLSPEACLPSAANLDRSRWRWLAPLGWLTLLSFWAERVFLEGLPVFPTDWDSLMYHVPLVDHWLQAGSLYVPDCPVWYNPGNNELLGLWIVAPFSGDFLIGLNNVPACLLLALGSLELARILGIRSPLDHLVALAVTATQVFYRQLVDNENDVAGAALWFACILYGMRYLQRHRRGDLALAAVSFGLLAGIKYYALGYAVVAWTGLSLCAWLQSGRRDALGVLAAGTLGGLLFGGYWYLRNIWLTGTPIYPQGLSPSTNALTELYPSTWRSTFLGSGRPEVVPLAVAAVWKMSGPCHVLALLAVPLVLGWLLGTGLLLGLRRRGSLRGVSRWLLAFLIAGAGAVLVVTPYAVEAQPETLDQLRWGYLPVRFGQCFLGSALLALGVLLSDLQEKVRGWTARRRAAAAEPLLSARRAVNFLVRLGPLLPAALLAGLIGWQMVRVLQGSFVIWSFRRLDVALLTLDVMAAGWLVHVRSWSKTPPLLRRAAAVVAPITAVAGLAWGTEALSREWHADFARHYDSLLRTRIFTDVARCDPSTTRLCAMDYRYYPFFGSRRQYSLCRPRKAFSYPWLIAYLQEHKVNVVACMLSDWREITPYRNVSQWIRDHPEVFVSQQVDGYFVWANIDHAQLARTAQP